MNTEQASASKILEFLLALHVLRVFSAAEDKFICDWMTQGWYSSKHDEFELQSAKACYMI